MRYGTWKSRSRFTIISTDNNQKITSKINILRLWLMTFEQYVHQFEQNQLCGRFTEAGNGACYIKHTSAKSSPFPESRGLQVREGQLLPTATIMHCRDMRRIPHPIGTIILSTWWLLALNVAFLFRPYEKGKRKDHTITIIGQSITSASVLGYPVQESETRIHAMLGRTSSSCRYGAQQTSSSGNPMDITVLDLGLVVSILAKGKEGPEVTLKSTSTGNFTLQFPIFQVYQFSKRGAFRLTRSRQDLSRTQAHDND
ncbi:hypothetical protein V8F20_009127 [Naviculisporaceae sp. PSN 640]